MIIVTVKIPVMEISYDFQIDEDVPLGIVKNEIIDMICRKNQCGIKGDKKELFCWDRKRKILLDMSRTPFENGLETGSELVIA